jgi:RNA polymerase sigma factor (TIGR02999 family)
METMTTMLARARAGERRALDAIYDTLYPELRRMAHARLAGHQRDALMQTTVLLHESYLRLLQGGQLVPADRAHFLGYAARVMRSVIVDAVRAAQRERRGGDAPHVPIDTSVAESLASPPPEEALDVDAALAELAALEPRLASVVEMRYFAGMKESEIAEALGVTERTVRRDWEKARLLLAQVLRR